MIRSGAPGSDLDAFLRCHSSVAFVEVEEALGSTPREAGAWMLVAPDAIFGTIGGGQLEFQAIDAARLSLYSGIACHLDMALGPEIGQCCGGRVAVSVRPADVQLLNSIRARHAAEADLRPSVFLFGTGHVGHALAASLALLPVRVIAVETRAEALEGLAPGVEPRLLALPEEAVRAAPPGSAFVVLTHDHALDFLLVAEALKRDDAAYVGMIGSKTKKATFRRWFRESAGGTEAQVSPLVSPIGGGTLRDKRPAVIAALAAAEIVQAVLAPQTGARGPSSVAVPAAS